MELHPKLRRKAEVAVIVHYNQCRVIKTLLALLKNLCLLEEDIQTQLIKLEVLHLLKNRNHQAFKTTKKAVEFNKFNKTTVTNTKIFKEHQKLLETYKKVSMNSKIAEAIISNIFIRIKCRDPNKTGFINQTAVATL